MLAVTNIWHAIADQWPAGDHLAQNLAK